VSVNDFFYRTQLMDLEAAKNAWAETGLNDVRQAWDQVEDKLSFDKDFKLNKLQKSLMYKKVQKDANEALQNIYRLDLQIAALKAKREGTGAEADTEAFKKRMFGSRGEKATTEAAPAKKKS